MSHFENVFDYTTDRLGAGIRPEQAVFADPIGLAGDFNAIHFSFLNITVDCLFTNICHSSGS